MSKPIIEELLSKLSIEEKVKILVGIGDTTSSQLARVPGAAGQTHPIERLNIPGFVLADGPAGVRIENPACRATAFPVEVMLASTWNPELVERVGKAMGEEARSCGVDVLLAPALNIHRHPLGGRNFEYFSEDPLARAARALPADSPKSVTYEEDIYVGYRYYDTFGKEPAYEFGYGLSYTTFSYSNLSIEQDSEQVTVKFRVTNTGKISGKEVAQVYVKPPRGKIDKPQKELKAFKKTRLIQPGEHEDIVINIGYRDMASFNGKEWVLEKGAYKILVGSSSRRILLEGEFRLHEEKTFRN